MKKRNLNIEQLGARNLMTADLGFEPDANPWDLEITDDTGGYELDYGLGVTNFESNDWNRDGEFAEVSIDSFQLENEYPELFDALTEMLDEAESEHLLEDSDVSIVVNDEQIAAIIVDQTEAGGSIYAFSSSDFVDLFQSSDELVAMEDTSGVIDAIQDDGSFHLDGSLVGGGPLHTEETLGVDAAFSDPIGGWDLEITGDTGGWDLEITGDTGGWDLEITGDTGGWEFGDEANEPSVPNATLADPFGG